MSNNNEHETVNKGWNEKGEELIVWNDLQIFGGFVGCTLGFWVLKEVLRLDFYLF